MHSAAATEKGKGKFDVLGIPAYLHVCGMITAASGTETNTSPTGMSLLAQTPRTVEQ